MLNNFFHAPCYHDNYESYIGEAEQKMESNGIDTDLVRKRVEKII
jgi:hypothetical protein